MVPAGALDLQGFQSMLTRPEQNKGLQAHGSGGLDTPGLQQEQQIEKISFTFFITICPLQANKIKGL